MPPSRSAAPITLRRARPSDCDALCGIEMRNFVHDRLSARQMASHMTNPNAEFWVATDRQTGMICGYVLVFFHAVRGARIYSVVADKAHRGKGIGRALMTKAITVTNARKTPRLWLEVRTRNKAAIALYEKLGFVPYRRVPAYYSDGADALKMLLNL
ncbi:GNAT family N-acetyltransferase [Micavibrio aeruginosavorus]|uniref:Acetyltransferase family protein n=1 Tax=Micavibrio aeruginosavorus (strain ARL-13) TaxID=856793 RepID=G2KLG8_MICAA|nr:N-acetyltransferase [Micavibrio aeruginosavorus]AEP08404.1 acetyltransferase family protein [Micavibrio aeruginosavorus ARL-13]